MRRTPAGISNSRFSNKIELEEAGELHILRSTELYVALIVVQFLHSLEEVMTHLHDYFPTVTGYIHERIAFFPILHVSPELFIAMNTVVVLFLMIVGHYLFAQKRWAWRIVRIVAYVEIINGLAHISAVIYTGGYFPGSISAIGLLIIGILLVRAFRSEPTSIKGRA